MKYRKKPIVIEAMKFDSSLNVVSRILEWSSPTLLRLMHNGLHIPTLEGTMIASRGDWIIKGIKGEFYPCKPDIFEASYEAVD